MNRKPIGPGIEVADQPAEAELAGLAREGFCAVVNLRHPGEPDQPLSPEAEGEAVRALGMDYLHVPVGGAPLSQEGVEAFGRFLESHSDAPVLVHCKMGARAAGLAMLREAIESGWDAAETIRQAGGRGVNLPPPIQMLIANYLSGRGAS